MIRRHLFIALAIASGATACRWSTFDDLESEAWVVSVERPENDSANWAVALQEMQGSGAGGRLAVIGASEALYNELAVSSTGDPTVADEFVNLNDEYGLVTLEPEPVLLGDPTSDAVALVTRSGSAIVVVHREGTMIDAYQIFGKDRPDGATYMVPPLRSDDTMAQPAQVVVAQDEVLIGAHYKDAEQPPNAVLPRCTLVDNAAQPVLVRSLGAFRPAGKAYDDVLVWSSTGELFAYDGKIFNGEAQVPACATGEAALRGPLDTGFPPMSGSQILTYETKDGAGAVTGRFAVLQGHDDNMRGYLALIDLDGFALVGSPRSDEKLRTAALFADGDQHFVVAGYPGIVIDGVTSGQVHVFELDATMGVSDASVMTLQDAQPEDDQSFGRALATFSFNNKPVIAVAADNEIFLYFRTALYDETRSK